MLKLRKFIAAVSAMTVMCSAIPTVGVYAADVSTSVYDALADGAKSVTAVLSYVVDNDTIASQAAELADEYGSSLDIESEKERVNEQCRYFEQTYAKLCKEALAENAEKVLAELGVEKDSAVIDENLAKITCTLTPEQVEKAHDSQLILSVYTLGEWSDDNAADPFAPPVTTYAPDFTRSTVTTATETVHENDGYPKNIERHINVEFRDDATHELIPDTSVNYWIDYSSHNKGGKVEQPTAVSADNGIYSFDITADIYAPKPDVIRNSSGWLCVEIMDIPENYRDYFTFYNETPKYEIEVWEDMPDDKLYTFYLINNEEWEKLKVIRYGEDIQNINEYTPVTTVLPSESESTTTTTVVPLSDLLVIRDSLKAFIQENNLPAKVVSNATYPGYAPVVIEYNADTGVNVGAILNNYIAESGLDRHCIGFVPIVDGVAMTTVNPDSETAATTTTTATSDPYEATTMPEFTTTDPAEAAYPYNSYVTVYVSIANNEIFKEISGVEFELYMHYYDDPADVVTSLGTYTTGDMGFEDDILIQAEKPCEIGFKIISTPEQYSKGYKSIVYPCDLFKRNPISNKLIIGAFFWAESTVSGDANGDYQVSVSDVVAILQYSANKQKYPIEEQYLANADCYDPGSGVNADDAFAAQQYDAKVISSLPMYRS